MSLTPNASPDELNSPFFLKNKEICESFEKFVKDKNGEVKGSYNASSYLVNGKFTLNNDWVLKIKKSTYTSGNLLLSSEYQNLHVLSEWKTKPLNKTIPEFRIEKNTFKNRLKSLINRNCTTFQFHNQYSLCSSEPESGFISELHKALKEPFDKREIYLIQFLNGILTIELRGKDLYLEKIEIIEKITKHNNI